MPSTPVVVLSIAGFDPSSGAGVTADVKTAAAHGCYALACITALTVQTTQGVRRIEPVSTALVKETLDELATDFSIAAVRIGMLGSAAVGRAVADFLRRSALPNVVLDPIYRASSGTSLLDTAGADLLKRDLLKLADVVTPNLEEAAALTGLKVTNLAEMKVAAGRLHELGARNVVVTGGHLEKPTDVLTFTTPGGRIEHKSSPQSGIHRGLLMERGAHLPLPLHVIWRKGAGSPTQCFWLRLTWRRRSPMLLHWEKGSAHWTICFGSINRSGAP